MTKMTLYDMRNLKEIWPTEYDGCLSNHACGTEIEDASLSEYAVNIFHNLKEVEIEKCPRLHNVFPLSIASGLDKLTIVDCGMVDSIIRNYRRKDEEQVTKIQFPHLKELTIKMLNNFVDFCTSCEEVEFPQLENVFLWSLPKFDGFASKGVLFDTKQVSKLCHLWVEECESIEVVFEMERCNKLISEEVAVLTQLQSIHLWNLKNVRHVWSKCPRVLPRGSLQNLSYLYLEKCDNLRYVFIPSIAKALVGLEYLVIEQCMDLEAIVAEEEDDKMEGTLILFPQLKVVSLKVLPKLKIITPEPTYRINFSSCTSLVMRGCDSTTVEANTNTEQSLACSTQIEVASLLKSAVSNFPNLEQVGFPQLEVLSLYSQAKFDGFHSKGVLYNIKQVPKLRYLEVKDCESIEVVFEMERCNKLITQQLPLLTQLQTIYLSNLKNVRHVWSKCPRVLPTGSLQNLRSLQIRDCDNLRYVFTPSIAEALVGLEYLVIEQCMDLEAIVAEEDDDKMEGRGETLIILFPQLKTLYLKGLPKLQQITPEPTYCINVSSCKQLKLEGCGKLKKTLMSDTILENIHALEKEKEKEHEEEEEEDDKMEGSKK